MNHSKWSQVLFVAIALMLVTTAFAADPDKPKQPSPEEMKKMMETWNKVAMPKAEHALLAKLAGKWDAKTTLQWSPETPAQNEKGTHTAEMILGGRYLWASEKGNWGGMPMEGQMLMGFDNYRNEYNLTWVDNMGTMMLFAKGTAEGDGKTIKMHGKMDEPMTGEKDKDVDYIFKIVDDDHYSFEMWDHPVKGPSFKALDAFYTRVK